MPKVTLNERSIRREPPAAGQIELRDAYLPGFGLRIASGGARTYFVMRRVSGRMVRRTIARAHIGDGPLAPGELSVADARDRARDVLAELARGIDPRAEAEEALQRAEAEAAEASSAAEAEASQTFKAVAEAYLADQLKGGGAKLRTRPELQRKLDVDLKAWHDRPITEITKAEIRDLVRAKAQTSPISANRLLSFIKVVFGWAAALDKVDSDPARGIREPGDEHSRNRYLDDREIRIFWKACDGLGDPPGRIFQLCLATGQRRGEVAGLRRSELGKLPYSTTVKDPKTRREKTMEVEGDAWILPEDRVKRKVEHAVPLSKLARALIDGAPALADAEGKRFDHILASGARGDQAVSGWSRYKVALDEAIGRMIAEEAEEPYDAERHKLAPWHLHDLRRTCATHLQKPPLSVPEQVISRILNHAEGDGRSQTATYTVYGFDREAVNALQAWGERLAMITGLNVVPMKGARA